LNVILANTAGVLGGQSHQTGAKNWWRNIKKTQHAEIPYGKTDNARLRIPMTPRVHAILDMRLSKAAGSQWVFPAPTKSGHITTRYVHPQEQRIRAAMDRARGV
jgi:hypothetical protein